MKWVVEGRAHTMVVSGVWRRPIYIWRRSHSSLENDVYEIHSEFLYLPIHEKKYNISPHPNTIYFSDIKDAKIFCETFWKEFLEQSMKGLTP